MVLHNIDVGSGHRTASMTVSIVVPGTGPDLQARLENANAQTWSRCEVIAIDIAPEAPGFIAAINQGAKRATGTYLSLLLPGERFVPHKVEAQVRFLDRFELSGMALYCASRYGNSPPAALQPTPDPSTIFEALYAGMPVTPAGMIFPRSFNCEGNLLFGHHVEPALFDLMLRLALDKSLVGMADVLVNLEAPSTKSKHASEWRDVYRRRMPDYLYRTSASGKEKAIELAIADRLTSRIPLAAFDLMSKAKASEIAMGIARSVASCLPSGVKRALHFARRGWRTSGAPRLNFDHIYETNGFSGTESVSGAGSTLFQTRVIRRRIPALLKEIGASTILDVPCGDFHWMQHVDLAGVNYIGADVVTDLITANRRQHSAPRRRFEQADLITGPLPEADLVFCRDCFVHLPLSDGVAALATILNTPARWLLTTTFPACTVNRELDSEGWRALNLELSPFNLPPPQYLIDEKCTEAGGAAGDKTLALWDLAELRARCGNLRKGDAN